VVFFFSQERIYWMFGVYDAVFLVPLALLLTLGALTASAEAPSAVSAR
jgi:hypothetical protein